MNKLKHRCAIMNYKLLSFCYYSVYTKLSVYHLIDNMTCYLGDNSKMSVYLTAI